MTQEQIETLVIELAEEHPDIPIGDLVKRVTAELERQTTGTGGSKLDDIKKRAENGDSEARRWLYKAGTATIREHLSAANAARRRRRPRI